MKHAYLEAAMETCRLLGDAIQGRPVSHHALSDEQALLTFSRAHHLETLICCALRNSGIDESSYRALRSAADAAAFHQFKSDLITADALDKLSAAGICVIPLKGAAIQAVYPDGWLRTATDTDLYIPRDALSAAAEVLTDAGFTQTASHNGDVSFEKPPYTVMELHTALGGYSRKQRRALERLSTVPFTVNEQYVYALFHLYKHMLYAGVGVRMFLDIYCLERALTDRQAVERWLAELELLPFDRAARTVNGILFDGNEPDVNMEIVVECILQSGAFGTASIYRAMKSAAHLTPASHSRRLLDEYCFDADSMALRYPILQRHRRLYPFCAAHRIVRGALQKRKIRQRTLRTTDAVDPKQLECILKTMHIL